MFTIHENGNCFSIALKIGHEIAISLYYRHPQDNVFKSSCVFFGRTDIPNEIPTVAIQTLSQQTCIKLLKLQECNLKLYKRPLDFFAQLTARGLANKSMIMSLQKDLAFDLLAPYSDNRIGAQSSVTVDNAQDEIEDIESSLKQSARLIKKTLRTEDEEKAIIAQSMHLRQQADAKDRNKTA